MKPRCPNVILVLTDDQGYGDLGCHGNPVVKTPHIDRFHAESLRFTNYHVGPTCAPTRCGLYTGHFANSTGVWHTVGGRSLLRGNEVTIADVFAENGYHTALFGKWHLGDNAPYRPQDRGFQHVVCHGGGGISQSPDYWGNDYFDDHYFVNGEARPFQGYCTDVFFGEAMAYIEEHAADPFLCFITCNAPHSPYNVDSAYSDPYRARVGTEERANFYGMITNLDENFGALDAKLDELGIREDTILIFMTDNGTSLGGPEYHTCGFRGIKNSEYDGGHRVPFFLRWPGGNLLSPRDLPLLTANIDFMPTLMDLCGIELSRYAHCDFHGASLVPMLRQGEPAWPDRVLVTDSQRLPQPVKWRKSAVMTQRWRLVNGRELYDMDVDPGQTCDVSAEHPDVVAALRSEYETWWALVSRQAGEEIPISIGDLREPVARLSSHDWRPFPEMLRDDPELADSNAYLAYDQSQIRRGEGMNGYFELQVTQSGRYRFELCRWPKEEGRGITEGIPESDQGWRSDVISAKERPRYSGGVAMPFTRAGLRIGEEVREREVAPEAGAVVFDLELAEGPTRLTTWLEADSGLLRGAYYVYVQLLETPEKTL